MLGSIQMLQTRSLGVQRKLLSWLACRFMILTGVIHNVRALVGEGSYIRKGPVKVVTSLVCWRVAFGNILIGESRSSSGREDCCNNDAR